jgi:hypothetical protein
MRPSCGALSRFRPAIRLPRRGPAGNDCIRAELSYIRNTQKEPHMNFVRSMHPRDWMIAAVAFIAGAIVF